MLPVHGINYPFCRGIIRFRTRNLLSGIKNFSLPATDRGREVVFSEITTVDHKKVRKLWTKRLGC